MKQRICLFFMLLFVTMAMAERTVIIYTDNDYGCGWRNQDTTITINNSFEMGTNIAVYAANGSNTISIMQLIPSGSSDPHAQSVSNLASAIQTRTGKTATFGGYVSLGVTDLSNVHMIYTTGSSVAFSLTATQKAALKSFLDRGGVLLVDDCSAAGVSTFETSFHTFVQELYGQSLSTLSSTNPIYSSYYSLSGTYFSYTDAGNGTQWGALPIKGLSINIPEPGTWLFSILSISILILSRRISRK